MFSLIITIVAIALVVALVAATMYHGGDTLTQGRATANAAAYVSGAQQIAGAQVMHLSLEGSYAADVPALVSAHYLASTPTATSAWQLASPTPPYIKYGLVAAVVAVNGAKSDEVCDALNKSAGIVPGVKVISGGMTPADATEVSLDTIPFGCLKSPSANVFAFKY